MTKHKTTGRYEAHLWDSTYRRTKADQDAPVSPRSPRSPKSPRSSSRRSRGRQVYLGGYSTAEEAAAAFDRAALAILGDAHGDLNFDLANYLAELPRLRSMSQEEVVASLRRGSTGFSRGASKYRGVTLHHSGNRWGARIGKVHGEKYLYLGTFASEEEAAMAYDRAAIMHRDRKAITNFPLSTYQDADGQFLPPSLYFTATDELEEEPSPTSVLQLGP